MNSSDERELQIAELEREEPERARTLRRVQTALAFAASWADPRDRRKVRQALASAAERSPERFPAWAVGLFERGRELYESGNLVGLRDALAAAGAVGALPEWMQEALEDLVDEKLDKRGRGTHGRSSLNADLRRYAMAVLCAREGPARAAELWSLLRPGPVVGVKDTPSSERFGQALQEVSSQLEEPGGRERFEPLVSLVPIEEPTNT